MREELEHRPLVLLFASLTAGLCTGWNPLIGLLIAIPIFFARNWPWRAAVLAVGAVGFALAPVPQKAIPLESREVHVSGVLTSMPVQSGKGMRAVLRGDDARTYLIRLPAQCDAAFGDRLSVSGKASPLREGYGDQQGALEEITPQGEAITLQEGPALFHWGVLARRSFIQMVGDRPGGPLLRSLILGGSPDLDAETREAFRRTGTYHLIAAAGLHLWAAGIFLGLLVNLLPVSREARLLGLLALLAIYAAAAGFHPPIIRAWVMFAVSFCAYLFRREADSATSLCLGGLANLAISPRSVFDLGFWLTLACVGAILIWNDAPQGGRKLWGELLRLAQFSAMLWAASSPLLAFTFGEVSAVSVLGNLVIVPLAGLDLILGLAGWVGGAVLPGLGQLILNGLALPLANLVEASLRWLGSLPFAVIGIGSFHPAWLLLFYAAGLLGWRTRVRQA